MTAIVPTNVHIRNNSSTLPNEGAHYIHSTEHAVIVITFFCILWILNLTGNGLVCVVIRRSRRVQSTTNYFVVSIAVSDLVHAAVLMPFLAVNVISSEWMFGDFMCRIIRLLQYATPAVTVFVSTSICIDRYHSIIHPLTFKITRSTAKKMILICWVLAYGLVSFSVYFFTENVIGTDKIYRACPQYVDGSDWMGVGFIFTLVFLHFIFPVLILIILYTKLFKYIWKAEIPSVQHIQRTMNRVSMTKASMVKMLMISTGTTILLLCPFYGTHVWFSISGHSVNHYFYIFGVLCVFSTGALKPFLYLYYNVNFRRGCKEVLCFSNSRCRYNMYVITTGSALRKQNKIGVMNSDSGHADSTSTTFDRSLHGDSGMRRFQNNNISDTWL